MPLMSALLRMYPYELVLDRKEGGEVKALENILKEEGLTAGTVASWKRDFKVKRLEDSGLASYVPITSLEHVALELVESHKVHKDSCVIGRKGSGKSTSVRRFAELVGAKIEPIVLFKVGI